mmetsp:Transcript_21847/g.76667  ORF Transcript_21847/g.76667 Transcript_21847/m.76667 type:complete len:248 (+) Transcript_21847:153-896(+)
MLRAAPSTTPPSPTCRGWSSNSSCAGRQSCGAPWAPARSTPSARAVQAARAPPPRRRRRQRRRQHGCARLHVSTASTASTAAATAGLRLGRRFVWRRSAAATHGHAHEPGGGAASYDVRVVAEARVVVVRNRALGRRGPGGRAPAVPEEAVVREARPQRRHGRAKKQGEPVGVVEQPRPLGRRVRHAAVDRVAGAAVRQAAHVGRRRQPVLLLLLRRPARLAHAAAAHRHDDGARHGDRGRREAARR